MARWQGADGDDTFHQNCGAALRAEPSHGWVQFRTVLISPDGAASPTLDDVTLSYRAQKE